MDEGTIKEVHQDDSGFSISLDEGSGFFLDKKYGVTPKKGDFVTLHIRGASYIQGVDINHKKVFYKTEEDIERERQEYLEKRKIEQQEKFEKNKSNLDAKYEKLPKFFKERIDEFRKNNPKFRVEYEAYELFCYEEAVLIAETLKTPEKVKELSESSDYWTMVPKLSKDHSGNTIGMAMRLAYWYLKDENEAKKLPGALSPLVGSKEYEEKNKRPNI